ncbi:MAG: signal peptidase II [Lachnospiraceae bacterium]
MNNFLWRQLRQKRRLFLWLSLLTILLVAIDQVTKYLAALYLKRQPLSIAEGVFSLHYFENTGTGFGWFADNTLGITIINFIILFVLLYRILILPVPKALSDPSNCLRLLSPAPSAHDRPVCADM